jgi:hypothetical protein
MLLYEGKFEKRAITIYEYAVDPARSARSGTEDLPTTIPSKMVSEHTLPGLTDQEPLAIAVSDFLAGIQHGRAVASDGKFSLRVLEILAAGEKSLRSGGEKVPI